MSYFDDVNMFDPGQSTVGDTPIEQAKLQEVNILPEITSPSVISSLDKAALYGDAGYGEGMTGDQTTAYDNALKLTGSTDIAKLMANLFGGKLGSALSTPAGALTGLAAIYALMGGNKATPASTGYKGSIPKLTATRAPASAPAARKYGEGAQGQQFFAPVTYAATGKYLRGDTDGMADKLDTTIDDTQPAKLSHGEFVVPADVVSHLGNGNSDAGAKVLYGMMDRVRKARTGTEKQGKRINPDKFTPGGIAGYADGGAVAFADGGSAAATSAALAGTPVSQSSNLSEWAGPYITQMLGQAQALGQMPYQPYMGQLTAGISPLQQQAFGGLSALVGGGGYGGYGFQPQMQAPQAPPRMQALSAGQGDADQAQAVTPSAGGLGTFGGMGGYGGYGGAPSSPWQFGLASNLAAQTGGLSFTQPGVSQAYMSPYMQNVVDVQQQQAQRQADIANQAQKAQFAQSGAFGGARFGIQQAQAAADLARQKQNIQAQGLQSAFQQGQQQFNAEQQARLAAAQGLGTLGAGQFGTQLQGLQALLGAGGTQQQTEQQALTALQNEYNKQMMWPYQQLQFQQSMLSGLPIGTTTTSAQQTGLGSLLGTAGGLEALYKLLGGGK